MGEKNWSCFKQSAVGCGCLVVAAVGLPVIMAVMAVVPLNRAVASRTELETTFGTQDAYVPAASGIPAPERIELFLEVKRALTPACDDFWKAERAVAAMEAFDDEVDPSKIAVMRQAMSLSRAMMGMGSAIGHFYETRNRALLDAGMGLGEYTYIYVLAYGDEIVNPSEELNLFGSGATNSRVRSALRAILRNQLAQLDAEIGTEDDTTALVDEIVALEDDPHRIPWQDGLPPEIDRALLPYRQDLDGLFCLATSPLELMINEKGSLAIENR